MPVSNPEGSCSKWNPYLLSHYALWAWCLRQHHIGYGIVFCGPSSHSSPRKSLRGRNSAHISR